MSTTAHLEAIAARCHSHGWTLLRAEGRDHSFPERIAFALRCHDGGQTVRVGSLATVEKLLELVEHRNGSRA